MDFESVAEQLRQLGCNVMREDERALVTRDDVASSWVILCAQDWIQIASVVLEHDELAEEASRDVLNEFVMQIHARYLGCRFGYDDDGALVIMSDVYPEDIHATHLVNVMLQMDAVARALLPLLRTALESGELPSDREVDRAFSSN